MSVFVKQNGVWKQVAIGAECDQSMEGDLNITGSGKKVYIQDGKLQIKPDASGGAPRNTYTNDAEVVRFVGGSSDLIHSLQDGTGRYQIYWNAQPGSNPVFLVGGEDAFKLLITTNGGFSLSWADGDGKSAGDAITWDELFKVSQNNGIQLPKDNHKLKIGAGDDLEFYHNGSESIINQAGTGNLVFQVGTTTQFYMLDGALRFPDGKQVQLGGDSDMRMVHNGSNTYFTNYNGNFYLRVAGGDNALVALPNSYTALYYDGAQKLRTLSTGIEITGSADINGNLYLNHYDTGWISNSDWTSRKLGSSAGGDLTHNLGTTLDHLVVRILFASNGTDAAAFEPVISSEQYTGGTSKKMGYSIGYVDTNTLRIMTYPNGIKMYDEDGNYIHLESQSYYYKVIVYRIG